jgi:hypothetical protein
MKRDLSWKPKRDGLLYCAPACGRGCTYAEYKKAIRDGVALATELGPKWISRVWENMGWHFSASTPGVEVHGTRNSGYTAFFVDSTFTSQAKYPRATVKCGLVQAREKLAALQALIEATKDL